MAKKKKAKTKVKAQTKALVLSSLGLTPQQEARITAFTPEQFVKERKGRGGKMVNYVEGGYVISTLNNAFGPLNWGFEVVKEEVGEKEVTVWGRLTVYDHKKGYKVFKDQAGGAIRHAEVELGDTKKAAATDALKKCASLFGIALDIYWPQDEATTSKKPIKQDPKEAFEVAKRMIVACKNPGSLIEYDEKMRKESKIFSDKQKAELHSLISSRVSELDGTKK